MTGELINFDCIRSQFTVWKVQMIRTWHRKWMSSCRFICIVRSDEISFDLVTRMSNEYWNGNQMYEFNQIVTKSPPVRYQRYCVNIEIVSKYVCIEEEWLVLFVELKEKKWKKTKRATNKEELDKQTNEFIELVSINLSKHPTWLCFYWFFYLKVSYHQAYTWELKKHYFYYDFP